MLKPEHERQSFIPAANQLTVISDVFVRDLVSQTTTLISVGAENWDPLLLDAISDAPAFNPV
jgi:hypothetical protein